MKSAREIYRKSLSILGESAEDENTLPYERRAVALINLLLGDLYELDFALKGETLPLQGSVPQITSLDDEIGMEESLVFSLIPLGLAFLLLNDEEPGRAALFLQLYQEERERLRRFCRRGRRHKITRPY